MAVMFPDISFKLREARMVTYNTRKGTTINISLEVNFTKVFHLEQADWFPEGTRSEGSGGTGMGNGGNGGGSGGRSGLGGYMEGAMPWETWARSQMPQVQSQMLAQAQAQMESQDTRNQDNTRQESQKSGFSDDSASTKYTSHKDAPPPRPPKTLNGDYDLIPEKYMMDLFSRATLLKNPIKVHAICNFIFELDEQNCMKVRL
ncbi:hypothetical protein B484DRAFT_231530 [Ochromonadaceae sp. CCMP2298]|nr:hypothetical protein B484DRAFT_231530 [Ochromonadaceae sp. CCMP2298]